MKQSKIKGLKFLRLQSFCCPTPFSAASFEMMLPLTWLGRGFLRSKMISCSSLKTQDPVVLLWNIQYATFHFWKCSKVTMIQSIITHPGSAHKDEFLACAVLLAENEVPVIRREPKNSDLKDPTIAVVDVGGENVPEQNNFDHHQLPRDHVPTCALSLVFKHLGLYKDAKEFCPWLEVTEWLDCRGPGMTSQSLGIDRDILSRLNSPVDIVLLRRFASQPEHRPGEPIWEVMRMLGKDLVGYIRNYRERTDFIEKHAEVWKLESSGENFKALFMPRTEPLPEEASAGLNNHVLKLGLENEVLALVYPDNRGKGYGLRRFKDAKQLDFRKLEYESDVHFAHAHGFIAKTSSTDCNRLKHLVEFAFIEEASK